MWKALAVAWTLTLAGFWCLAQAQVPVTGAGVGAHSSGGGGIGTPTKLVEHYGAGTITTVADAPIGNLTVIWVWQNAGTPVATLTDSASNTYAQAVSFQYATSGSYCTIYYLSNTTHDWPSGGTIAVANNFGTIAATVSGANSGLDVTATGSSNSGTPTLSSGTLGQATEIVFAGVCNDQNFGAPSGFTETSPFSTLATAQGTQAVDFAYSKTSATTPITYAPAWSAGNVQGPMTLASFKH